MGKNLNQFSGLKIFRHCDRISKLQKGNRFYPVSVDLSPSNLCNHNCIWCRYGRYRSDYKDMLDRELMSKLVKELAQLGVKGINFTGGGEPLSNPYIIDIMEKAHQLGMDVGLITNGSYLDKAKIKRLVKICCYIRISLDAAKDLTYARLHGVRKNEFVKVMKNMKMLVAEKKKERCLIGVQILLADENKNEIYEGAKRLKTIGVDFLEIRPVVDWDRSIKEVKMCESFKFLRDIEKLSRPGFKISIRKDRFRTGKKSQKGKGYQRCFAHYFIATISADAKVYFCCEFLGDRKFSFGSLKKKSFQEIWDSKRRMDAIRKLDVKKCQSSCKGDNINKTLTNLDRILHPNIL